MPLTLNKVTYCASIAAAIKLVNSFSVSFKRAIDTLNSANI